MAVFRFSALSDGQAISFTPTADVLNFDQTQIAAADLRVTASGANTRIEVIAGPQIGKDVTLLNTVPFQLSVTNVTFADGSRLLFGDNSTAQNDNLANSLTGTAGRDLLAGFGGADTMNGGLGNDTYIVGTGDVLSDPGGIDTIESDINWSLADGFENLTATGSAAVSLTGNNAANLLVGNAAANFFNPRGGDDTIQGGAGNDLIRLGGGGVASYGTKVIDGGAGFDTLDFGGFAKSAMVVDLAAGTLSGGGDAGQGSAGLTGIEAVIGDAFNDRLSGSAAAESLNGGGGNDTLEGRGGNDTLTGGLGADTFAFAAASTGFADTVTDFVSGTDKFSFDLAAFTGLGPAGNFAAGDHRFMAGAGLTSALNPDDRLLYDTSTGRLFYDPDGSGGRSSELVATLPGAPALAATDIVATGQVQPNPGAGTPGNDSLTGTEGDDSISGLGGNDTIDGRGGNDTLDGGTGFDTLDGGDGSDRFLFSVAPSSNNLTTITHFARGSDKIVLDARTHPNLGPSGDFSAGDGRFLLISSGGAPFSTDGAETRVIYDTSTTSLYYDPDGSGSARPQLMAHVANPLVANDISVVNGDPGVQQTGTSGNDSLAGTASNDTLDGGAGNDALSGLGGNDSLIGGAGNDLLDGGAGSDTMDGGLGDDTYIVDGEFVPFDVLTDAGGVDTIIFNGSGGGSGGLPDGFENLTVRGSDRTVSDGAIGGNEADNVLRNETGTADMDIFGGGGNDTLIGGNLRDQFVFSGAYGNDVVDGGGGFDALDFADAVTVDFRTGTATSAGGSLSFTNIELVLGSSSGDLLIADDSGVAFRGRDGDDTLTGGAGDDFLIAGNFDGQSNPISRGGNAVINGGGGNDDIWLNIGDDRADGGTGNDTFHVQGNLGNDDIGNDTIGGGDGIDEINLVNFSPIVVDLGAGTMTGGGPQGTATISFTGIENFTTGGVATVIGNSSANDLRVTGQGTIDGAGGNDTLSGGNGDGDIFIFGQAPGTANSDFITNFQSASDTLELDARVMPALGASGRFAMGDARFFAAAGATSGHDADDRIVYNSSTGNVFYDADGSGAGAAQLIATLQQGAALTAADVVVANGGAPGGQLIQGTSGDDTLGGTNGNDTLDGLAGNDVVDGGLGTDLVRGGSGNDRLKDRADSVASAPDTLDGGLGNDIFDLLANPSRPHATVLVDAGGVDTVWANHNFTLPAGIENLTLFEGFAGQGNELDNTIVAFGNLPNYSLEGAAGNDTLIGAPDSTDGMTGGAGSDVFAFLRLSSNASGFGGGDNVFDFVSGTDTLQLDNTGFANLGAPGRFSPGDERFFLGNAAHDASDRVIFADATGRLLYDPDGTGPAQALMIARIQGLVATDIVVVGEAAPPPPASIAGTAGNDSLTGTAGNDSILGLAGSDTINALGGNDTLDGGAGIDNLNGGFGNDTYIVGAGDVLSDTDGIDTVVSDANWSLADGFENLTLTGTANLTATGNNAANVLVGNSGNNFFNPRGGDDTIQAGAGNDLIRLGGGGVPTYGTKVIDGGAGFDTLDFGGFARSAFSVNLATGSLGGGGEAGQGTARLAGIEAVIGDGFNDALVGSAGADSLNGGGGNDAVSGGAGNDTLEGGVGIDTLNGGAGLDSFVFHQAPPAGGVDFITDFTSGSDKLLFDNAAFTALGADGAFAAGDGRFLAGPGRSSGSDASDRLIYDTTAGTLWYDADGSGQGSSQQIATLVGHPALAATDITVI